jgi:hypothetical protein
MPSRSKQILLDLVGVLALAIALLAATVSAHAETLVLPKIIGCTADGKYKVYELTGGPGQTLFAEKINGQWYLWTDIDLYNHLPHLKKSDVDLMTYFCDQSVCYTTDGFVVGAAPLEH